MQKNMRHGFYESRSLPKPRHDWRCTIMKTFCEQMFSHITTVRIRPISSKLERTSRRTIVKQGPYSCFIHIISPLCLHRHSVRERTRDGAESSATF